MISDNTFSCGVDIVSEENTWAFGQWFPVLLLLLPLLSMGELFYGKTPSFSESSNANVVTFRCPDLGFFLRLRICRR